MKVIRYINGVKVKGENMPKLEIVNAGVIQLYTDVQLRLQNKKSDNDKCANK